MGYEYCSQYNPFMAPKESRLKVYVAMSGGVDSSVAALLLQRAGYDVTGVFMKNWSDTKNDYGECAWRDERRDAERVAALLGISLLTFDFEEEYRREVVAYMDREYASGRTPNPDVMCNEKIKFDVFYQKAKELGADAIATGHYARVERLSFRPASATKLRGGEKSRLLKAVDENKDQTYFIYRIKPKVLHETLFPIGQLTKSEVRAVAREAGLPVAEKKDSQGLCFVGKVNLHDFLKSRIPPHEGDVLDMKGKVIGKHDGVMYYTIGQRHGLDLGLPKEHFVVERNLATNTITVSEDKFDPKLMMSEIILEQMHWLVPVENEMKVMARIRYRQPLSPAKILRGVYPRTKRRAQDDERWLIRFEEPQWAVAPGQSVVCYDDDRVVGGGIIA